MNSRFKRAVSSLPLATALMFGIALPGSGQRRADSINFGAQTFQVGMSKADALSRLALCCSLTGRDDSFTVTSKGPPFEMYGGIRFADGVVVSVERDLSQFQETGSVVLAQTIYRRLSELSNSDGHAVSVRTSQTEGTNVTMRDITLSFPNGRSLVIEINKVDADAGKMKDWVSLEEYLRKP
ncbi:MAG TPA: hypothetical protein VMI32_05595 [Candidatus Solibacter sp.]|nr:hypothetical protein [Candidatus Solibacter sp.]